MIWKTEVEVTLASLQVEWRYECLLRKKKLSPSFIFWFKPPKYRKARYIAVNATTTQEISLN